MDTRFHKNDVTWKWTQDKAAVKLTLVQWSLKSLSLKTSLTDRVKIS